MMGVAAHPTGTLLDGVLAELQRAPCAAQALCERVLGLPRVPKAVAERVVLALLGADPRIHQLADGRWGLVAAVQESPSLDACTFAVVDVETTGMRAWGGDRITEIAVVVVQGSRRELVFDSLVDPGKPIPAFISAMTGISDATVRCAPSFADIADDVLSALGGRVFVAHNARFDWSFVSAELHRTRAVALDGPSLCTVRLARRLVHEVRSCSLDNLSQYFSLTNDARHRAAGDAIATGALLHHLLGRAQGEGARTLQDLEAIASRRAPRRPRTHPATPTGPLADSVPEGPA
jgi:DNA polymerase-3 subunit epsilon